MNPDHADRDGNAFLGITFGLALTAILIGFLWIVLGSTVFQWAGVLLILASVGVFVALWNSTRDAER